MAEPTRKRRRPPPKAGDLSGNQGEGNREADRRYRDKASKFAKSDRAERAANEARRSVEGDAARDAGVEEQLDEIAREQREQRRRMGGPAADDEVE